MYSMKVKDKNFGIETATETIMFRMVGTCCSILCVVMWLLNV